MGWLSVLALAVGLAMDAFAAAVCKGLAMEKVTVKTAGIVGLWFGGFQAGMPLLGYLLGVRFKGGIMAVDHWIAFLLLGGIGVNMLREARSQEEEKADASLRAKVMLVLAVATSIDALAAGITLAFLEVNVMAAVLSVGAVTFVLSAAGVKIGNLFGSRCRAKAELAGGIILLLIGTKILLEHLGIIGPLPF